MDKPQGKYRVLFLCTGNSCRSQLAEAMTNRFLSEQWAAFSAGTQPAGTVHPLAIQVLAEIGINHAGASKSVEEFKGQAFDLVITVCDDAAENCPVWLGKGVRMHLGFPDPAKATGTEEVKLAAFRRVRDDIHNQVLPVLSGFKPPESQVSAQKRSH